MDIESSPVNRRLASRTSDVSVRTAQTDDSVFYGDVSVTSSNSLSNNGNIWYLAKHAVTTITFTLIAWHAPRYAMNNNTSIVEKVIPYQIIKAGDVIRDFALNEPLIDPPTISSILLIRASVWLPLIFIAIVSWWTTARIYNSNSIVRLYHLHASTLGFIFAIGLSEGCTNILKLYVQRRRPNFYALCGFDDTALKCTALPEDIREANFSFPSGHSSLANCAMTYVVWFCLGQILLTASTTASTTSSLLPSSHSSLLRSSVTATRAYFSQLGCLACLACVVPWAWAAFVGSSRLVDRWHHPSDVGVGLVLGAIAATVAYHYWFCFLTPASVWVIQGLFSGNFGGSSSNTNGMYYTPGLPWSLLIDGISLTTTASGNEQQLLPMSSNMGSKLPSFED